MSKDICQIKGEELEQWLKEERKNSIKRLEEYYKEEMEINRKGVISNEC